MSTEMVMAEDQTVVSRDVWLPHPSELVFAAVMSPEIAPQIDPAVRRWEPDRRPIRVGTQFTIRGWFQWLPVRGRSRTTVWQPPSRAEFEAVQPTWPVRLHAVHAFDRENDGTRYRWTVTFHHPNVIGRAVTRLAAPLLQRTIADQNRTLAAWLDENPERAATAEL